MAGATPKATSCWPSSRRRVIRRPSCGACVRWGDGFSSGHFGRYGPGGAGPYDAGVDVADPVVEGRVSVVASAVNAKLLDITDDVWHDLIRNIPELRGDDAVVRLLAASVESNITTLLHMLEHGLVPESLQAPAA